MATRANPSLKAPEGLRVTKLRREDGVWKANASLNGRTVAVDRRYGSWQALVRVRPEGTNRIEVHRKDLRRGVAAALEGALKTAQRREEGSVRGDEQDA